jgi:hypothetical protein
MSPKKHAIQAELFGVSEAEDVKQRIKELDALIANALKRKLYDKAKELTEQQETLLKKLVDP